MLSSSQVQIRFLIIHTMDQILAMPIKQIRADLWSHEDKRSRLEIRGSNQSSKHAETEINICYGAFAIEDLE